MFTRVAVALLAFLGLLSLQCNIYGDDARHRYRVTLKTRATEDGGTDERVFILLKGTKGNVTQKLDDPNKNDREQGKKDVYEFTDRDIGTLNEVGFRMEKRTNDGNFRWCCDWVEVEDLDSRAIDRIPIGWVDRFDYIFWKMRTVNGWMGREDVEKQSQLHVVVLAGRRGQGSSITIVDSKPIKSHRISYSSKAPTALVSREEIRGNTIKLSFEGLGIADGTSFLETIYVELFF